MKFFDIEVRAELMNGTFMGNGTTTVGLDYFAAEEVARELYKETIRRHDGRFASDEEAQHAIDFGMVTIRQRAM